MGPPVGLNLLPFRTQCKSPTAWRRAARPQGAGQLGVPESEGLIVSSNRLVHTQIARSHPDRCGTAGVVSTRSHWPKTMKPPRRCRDQGAAG